MKVIIVHGFGGIPNGGWFPWLMKELATRDIPAYSFLLPHTEDPVVDEWVKALDTQLGCDMKGTILLGHSLGATGILRYLEQKGKNFTSRLQGVVLVSGLIERLEVDDKKSIFRKLDSFVEPAISLSSLQDLADTFVVIHGKKDNIVPLFHAEKIARELKARLEVIEDGDHFSQKSQPICYELPKVLEVILGIV